MSISAPGADTSYLTGMRGVAALFVFVAHSGGLGLRSFGPLGENFVANTKFGVAIFFVISACCLCLVTADSWNGAKVAWPAFYVRRIFRIVPLYFVALFVASALLVMRGTAPPDLAWSLVSHLTFFNIIDAKHAHDVFVEWTIVVEFAFYLIFPLALAATRQIRWGILLVALLLSWRSLRLFVIGQIGGEYADSAYFTLPFHLYAFLFGMGAFALIRRRPLNRGLSEVICLVSIAYFLWAMLQPDNTTNEVPMTYATTGLIVGCANPDTLLARALRTPLLLFTGAISFSIYMVHTIVLSFFPTPTPLVDGYLALAATLAISAMTYRYIETPFRGYGRHVADWATRRRPVPKVQDVAP